MHAVARGTIDPSAIRRLQNAPMDGVPGQKFLLIDTSSLLNAERNDAGTGGLRMIENLCWLVYVEP